MRPYVEFILVILLPTAVGYGLIGLFRGFRWAGERQRGLDVREPASR